jgi:hypothetical protein
LSPVDGGTAFTLQEEKILSNHVGTIYLLAVLQTLRGCKKAIKTSFKILMYTFLFFLKGKRRQHKRGESPP